MSKRSVLSLQRITKQYGVDLLKKLSSLNVSNDISKADDGKSVQPYSSKFKKELEKTQFTIFVPIKDCGYYGWIPRDAPPQSLSNLKSADEIVRHVDIDLKPKELLPFSQLKVPRPFDMSLPADEYQNKYPFGQYDVASLYVASKHRNVDLDEIDFVFGGSTLEMLANCDTSNPYMVCRIPTSKANHTLLLVRKCKEYNQNYADIGFQFERYVTTGSMCRKDPIDFIEHMQVMEIGTNFKVLLCAEADAVDDDLDPIEIKASNPKNWGTKVMFQMISSGSPTLCCGVKGKNILTNVTMRSLSNVATDALRNRNCNTLEKNIVNGMQALLDQMIDVEDYESYKISFNDKGGISLHRAVTRIAVMLPPHNVVKELVDVK